MRGRAGVRFITMSQPLSHPDLRRRNLSLLLGTVLRHQDATRKEIELESGLSKATVSRLADELLQAGALVSRPVAPADPSARGRRAETLSPAASLGLVAGLSLGVRMTSIFVTDLSGRELAWQQIPTPKWTGFEDAVDWSVEVVSQTVGGFPGPLRRVVVAIPGRAIDGAIITRPPLFMAAIEGDAFARVLAERLACPIRIELDATMVLVGLESLGFIDASTAPVLLNASSILTMSLRRRDGTIARGLTASFGDFELIPVEAETGPSTLGALLGAHGLFELSRRLGHPLDSMEDLWESEGEDLERLREVFCSALMQAIRIIAVMTDPALVIFTGTLSPLVRLTLPRVEAVLRRELTRPPELRVIGHVENGYPAALGGAREARTEAASELLDRVSGEGLSALS